MKYFLKIDNSTSIHTQELILALYNNLKNYIDVNDIKIENMYIILTSSSPFHYYKIINIKLYSNDYISNEINDEYSFNIDSHSTETIIINILLNINNKVFIKGLFK